MFLRRGEQGSSAPSAVRRKPAGFPSTSVTNAVGSPPTRSIPQVLPRVRRPLWRRGYRWMKRRAVWILPGRDACWTHPFRALQALCDGSDHGSGRDGKSGFCLSHWTATAPMWITLLCGRCWRERGKDGRPMAGGHRRGESGIVLTADGETVLESPHFTYLWPGKGFLYGASNGYPHA